MEYTDEELSRLTDFMSRLAGVAKWHDELKELNDKKIGQLLFQHVWSDTPIDSPKSAIVEQAFLRLGFNPQEWEE